MSDIYTIGINLAKSVFQLCAFDKAGEKLVNRALRRNQVIKFLPLSYRNGSLCQFSLLGSRNKEARP